MTIPIRTMTGACLLAIAPITSAADFCVTTSAQLQAALEEASFNGADDTIRLVAGIFLAPPTGFAYDSDGIPQHLGLQGGFNSDCGARTAAAKSTISAGDVTGAVGMRLNSSQGSLSVSDMVFREMPDSGESHNVALLVDGAQASVVLDGNAFLLNAGSEGSALVASGRQGTFVLTDNVFFNNTTRRGIAKIGGSGVAGGEAIACRFENNTSYGNFSTTNAAIELANCMSGIVASNVLYNNSSFDLHLIDPAATQNHYLLDSNDIGTMSTTGLATVTSTGNFSADPKFAGLSLPFVPSANSPLVDAGSPDADANSNPTDYLGNPRISGSAADIGAFELQPQIFGNGFE